MNSSKRIVMNIFEKTLHYVKKHRRVDESVHAYIYFHGSQVKQEMHSIWNQTFRSLDASSKQRIDPVDIVNHLTMTDFIHYLNQRKSQRKVWMGFAFAIVIPILFILLIILSNRLGS